MSVHILDGKQLAQNIRAELKAEVDALQNQTGKVPHVVNIIVGEDPSACAYANSQQKMASGIGINYELINFPNDVSQEDLKEYILKANSNDDIHGIMIHKPVPDHINYSDLAGIVNPSKDLEGINVVNIGKMILEDTKILPCTPAAVMAHLESTGVDLKGKDVTLIGHSEIVGKPLTLLLLGKLATVSICHVGTSEAGKLEEHVQRADVVIVAVGVPELVKGDWIKQGAIVIDVGINKVNGKIVGDVHFDSAKDKASFITPVPGGVGPVTVTMLMKNGIETFKQQVGVS